MRLAGGGARLFIRAAAGIDMHTMCTLYAISDLQSTCRSDSAVVCMLYVCLPA
jgi:hypothetical protein